MAQAAAFIVDDAVSCAEYRTLLADRTRRLADLFPNASGDDYDRELAATWSLAAERADSLAPAGLARPMLLLTAVLDPDGIPEAVLMGPAACAYVGGTPGDARKALRNLHRLSLVSHDPDDPLASVRMHALAQRSALEAVAAAALPEVLRSAADALLAAWREAGKSPRVTTRFLANGVAWLEYNGGGHDALMLHPLMTKLGTTGGEIGLPKRAHGLFTDLAAAATIMLGRLHPDTLAARYEVGYWLGEQGDFAGAAEAQERLLADRIRVLGEEHTDTLGTRANLAYWRGHAGDPARAAEETAQVLAVQLRVLDPDDPAVLSNRHNLAHWRGLAGDPQAAADGSAELLADAVRILGPDHPDTLDTRRNLAHWRGLAGDPAAAVEGLDAVLADYVRVLGPDHPDTMHVRENLAHWRPAELDALIADSTRVLGPDHPQTRRAQRMRQSGQ